MSKFLDIRDQHSKIFGHRILNSQLSLYLGILQLIVVLWSLTQHLFSMLALNTILHCDFSSNSTLPAVLTAVDAIIFDFGLFHSLWGIDGCVAQHLDGGYGRFGWCITHSIALIFCLPFAFVSRPKPYYLWPLLIQQSAYGIGLLILSLAALPRVLPTFMGDLSNAPIHAILFYAVGTLMNFFLLYIYWHWYWYVEAMWDSARRVRSTQLQQSHNSRTGSVRYPINNRFLVSEFSSALSNGQCQTSTLMNGYIHRSPPPTLNSIVHAQTNGNGTVNTGTGTALHQTDLLHDEDTFEHQDVTNQPQPVNYDQSPVGSLRAGMILGGNNLTSSVSSMGSGQPKLLQVFPSSGVAQSQTQLVEERSGQKKCLPPSPTSSCSDIHRHGAGGPAKQNNASLVPAQVRKLRAANSSIVSTSSSSGGSMASERGRRRPNSRPPQATRDRRRPPSGPRAALQQQMSLQGDTKRDATVETRQQQSCSPRMPAVHERRGDGRSMLVKQRTQPQLMALTNMGQEVGFRPYQPARSHPQHAYSTPSTNPLPRRMASVDDYPYPYAQYERAPLQQPTSWHQPIPVGHWHNDEPLYGQHRQPPYYYHQQIPLRPTYSSPYQASRLVGTHSIYMGSLESTDPRFSNKVFNRAPPAYANPQHGAEQARLIPTNRLDEENKQMVMPRPMQKPVVLSGARWTPPAHLYNTEYNRVPMSAVRNNNSSLDEPERRKSPAFHTYSVGM